MATPELRHAGSAGKRNGKRVRQCATTTTAVPVTAADRVLDILEVHDLAYWCQWRLAILHVSARFEAAAQVRSDTWCREQLDQVSISQQAALSSEVRHLESQLGKHTSMNAKLEAALSVNAEALGKAESARVAATAAVSRLQAQMSYDKDTATVSTRELEEKISRSNTARERLTARLHEAEAARLAAELKAGELLQRTSDMESELSEALSATDKALEESLAERARVEAMQGDVAKFRDKYSTLKRRYVDAGRKVEAVRAERDALRLEHATLEDKLADAERFQTSKPGQALDRMEQELATEKMARVELEADRDDLQSQLAAALQATAPA